MNSNSIITTVKESYYILSQEHRKGAIYMIVLTFLSSILELVGLASMLPLFAIVLTDDFLIKYPYAKVVYDFFGFSSEMVFVCTICFAVLFLLVFKSITLIWITKKQNEYSWDVYKYINIKMYTQTLKKGYTFFFDNNSSFIQNDVVNTPGTFVGFVLKSMLTLFNEICVAGLIIVSLIVYTPMVCLILSVIIVPVFYFFYSSVKVKIKTIGSTLMDNKAITIKLISDTCFGYTDISVTNTFDFFKTRLYDTFENNKKLQVKSAIFSSLPAKIIELTIFLSLIIVMVYGLLFFESKSEIIALISIFGLSAYRLIPTSSRIMGALMNIQSYENTIDIIKRYFNLKYVETGSLEANPLPFKNEIVVDNLSFQYPDTNKNVLSNISFSIKKGDTIGLVGESGSGKTTFINVFLRFLYQNSGDIIVDGMPLTNKNELSWKKKIGYVRQEVFLLDGTIAENIAFGIDTEEIDHNKLQQVIEKTSLLKVIQQLEDGVETKIGERGAKLSGGQRQRIGIARALYHDVEILVFDEATSALDTNTEEEITNSINEISSSQLTILMIAHRISTLKYCDKILVFDDSRLLKETTYEDISK